MDVKQATEYVIKIIEEALNNGIEVTKEMQLVGESAILDSMKLVEVCLALEDLAEQYEFDFDWTSESAMSKSRSMFRNAESLAQEFSKQSGK